MIFQLDKLLSLHYFSNIACNQEVFIMRKFNFFALMLAVVFAFGEVYAACPPKRKNPSPTGGRKSIKGIAGSRKLEISGRLRRLEEDASDLDRKLRRAKPDGSKRYINMTFERYKLALEMVHECHRYIEDYGDKKQDTRLQDIRNLLKRESTMLLKGLKGNKDFPYPESLSDWQTFTNLLRAGKVSNAGRLPKGDAKLRSDIHDMQKKALENIHKSTLNNRKN